VILEPLDLSHVDGLLAAIGDPEVFRHIPWPQPTDPAGMAALVTSFLADAIAGQRVPFTQRDAETGEIAGTTSYMTPDPDRRSVEIGSTMIGRRWWRTGINTEAKLLLLRHAFEELGAVRVEWQTDIRNERSQAAIARLGATREGVLRRNRKRGDGSFRDSVVYSMIPDDWPAARERLSGMLERPETDR
jgi:RimJ/RimL family protein N-acetyltransferase